MGNKIYREYKYNKYQKNKYNNIKIQNKISEMKNEMNIMNYNKIIMYDYEELFNSIENYKQFLFYIIITKTFETTDYFYTFHFNEFSDKLDKYVGKCVQEKSINLNNIDRNNTLLMSLIIRYNQTKKEKHIYKLKYLIEILIKFGVDIHHTDEFGDNVLNVADDRIKAIILYLDKKYNKTEKSKKSKKSKKVKSI